MTCPVFAVFHVRRCVFDRYCGEYLLQGIIRSKGRRGFREVLTKGQRSEGRGRSEDDWSLPPLPVVRSVAESAERCLSFWADSILN